ncbi:Hypothetical protein PBC10988_7490 [Planctomycetales bacterium 10988]|nr:Hypothetical protein PBC10988_7490 [Planctomycetales bacterium 10988]
MKPSWTVVGLLASVGVPYAAHQMDFSSLQSTSSPEAAVSQDSFASSGQPAFSLPPGTASSFSNQNPLSNPPQGMSQSGLSRPQQDLSIETLLRFDRTKPWVMATWPRVSTAAGNWRWAGYRVPLLTGTQEQDLAGSLTYYFDEEHVCQRITFQGTTGNAAPLAHYVQTYFGFEPTPDPNPSAYLYQQKYERQVVGFLKIEPSSVVQQAHSLDRFRVNLVIQRLPE